MHMDKLKYPLLAKFVIELVPIETVSDQIITEIDSY
jgi:hypothetical protein